LAREVGTEGKLGGQARVEGVAGTWKDLTTASISWPATSTAQVRNIADVTTAVPPAIVEENHRRCEGRNPGVEKHHQHDGRSA